MKKSSKLHNSQKRSHFWIVSLFSVILVVLVFSWKSRLPDLGTILVPQGSPSHVNLNYEVDPDVQEVLPKPKTTTTPMPSESEHTVGEHGVFKGRGFKQGHLFDPKLSEALTQFFKSEKATSILELGAGRGDYARMFRSEGFFVSCYDGNPDTQYVSDGRCGIIDLSRPIDFCKHDWVLSLEVGEHIPREFEEMVISNMDKGNKKGLIVSWAVEGQAGLSHVNNRNNDYIRGLFNKLGYESDFEGEKIIRNTATLDWFKNTLMVFRRKL